MPKPSLAVRFAASSILLLSFVHIAFWALMGFWVHLMGINGNQFTILFVAIGVISVLGLAGVAIAVGVLKAKNWARVGALALGGVSASISAFALFVLFLLIALSPPSFGLLTNLVEDNRGGFVKLGLVYLFVFSLAVWWIVLFSRKSVVAQFSSGAEASISLTASKPVCPPPIALLAWLSIICSALAAFSWPLIFGRIPAMLFTRVYPIQTSQWIWAANILLFLLCGVGLLKLYRWSYDATIVLHVFWTVSLFFSQFSPNYPGYIRACLLALEFPSTINDPTAFVFPYWLTAILSVVPTFLLVVGLFYYRRSFLRAAAEAAG